MINKTRQTVLSLILILVSLSFFSCETHSPSPKDLAAEALIPHPVSVEATGSSFALTETTDIYLATENDELNRIGQYLADGLNPVTGLEIGLQTGAAPESGHISLSLDANDEELGEEGYVLTISEKQIGLTANQPAGIFRGVQTLKQLLPASIEGDDAQEGPWEIATGTIRDFPAYEYRGSMLDVSRHFFPAEDVKEYIDHLARYKFNYLHLHLSDDQGWRIEIKSWPRLVTHGGSTEVGGGEGGYYTQEQYKDMVQYAQDRYITIVPEIDMPGHTNAALSSYPELNCDNKAPELYTGTEVGFSTLCTRKDITYKFVDDVISELAAMTPGPYIHIGGDESHVTAKDDYIYFIDKVQDIVQSHGKTMIGWDEVALANFKPGSIAQYWAKAENAKMAVDKGGKVIVSPAKKAYLDMKYDSTTTLGLKWAGYIEVDTAYQWDPAMMVDGVNKEHILGIEAPLWTETVTNMEELEYLVFPRLLAYAEIGWSPGDVRQWEDFRRRLARHKDRLETLGVGYYASRLIPWGADETDTEPEDTPKDMKTEAVEQ